MDPMRIIFTLVANLTSKIVGFVNGLFEPTNKPQSIDAEVISAVKKKSKTEEPKLESVSTIKPSKIKEKETFNIPIQSVQRQSQRPVQGVSGSIGTVGSVGSHGTQGVTDPFGWINIDEQWININDPIKVKDVTKYKTRIALNDENDMIEVWHDGSSYVIE